MARQSQNRACTLLILLILLIFGLGKNAQTGAVKRMYPCICAHNVVTFSGVSVQESPAMRVSFDDLLRVRIPASLAARVRDCAEAKEQTVSELVRDAIRTRLEQEASRKVAA